MLTVIITPQTRQHPMATYVVGNNLSVFGEREGDTVTAVGVRPVPESFDPNWHRNMKRGKVLPMMNLEKENQNKQKWSPSGE